MAAPRSQLAPVPQQLAIFDHMVAQESQTLVLKEKMFDYFDIKLVEGTPILRVEGKIMSLHGRKEVFDSAGQHLFTILKELWHLHTTFVIQNPKGEKLMEVRSSITLFGSKAKATFTANTGKSVTLVMKGNWLDTSAEIADEASGVVVARIDRKFFNARELLLGHQTYHLTVAPGVDMALLAAMCICLDEKRNEN